MKKPPAKTSLRWFKRLLLAAFTIVLLGIGIITYANVTAIWASHGKLYNDIDAVPPTKVALIFGTSDRYKGRENRYFTYRIDAAEKIWKAGKVKTFIVSGDNREMSYNEPQKMREALIKRGIPGNRIVSDYAGLRTLDSVVRAKKIFGTDRLLFISQKFQNERAIYIAKANGIESHGFNAQDVETQAGLKTKIREIGARVKMWLDVNFLATTPRHLGDPIEMPE